MRFNFDAVALSVNSRQGKDGKVYYHLNMDQDGEIFTFECSEDVSQQVEIYVSYHFTGSYVKGEYNGRVYSRMGVVSAERSGKGA